MRREAGRRMQLLLTPLWLLLLSFLSRLDWASSTSSSAFCCGCSAFVCCLLSAVCGSSRDRDRMEPSASLWSAAGNRSDAPRRAPNQTPAAAAAAHSLRCRQIMQQLLTPASAARRTDRTSTALPFTSDHQELVAHQPLSISAACAAQQAAFKNGILLKRFKTYIYSLTSSATDLTC